MDEINKTKKRSFWSGLLSGVLIAGFILAIVTFVICASLSESYSAMIDKMVAEVGQTKGPSGGEFTDQAFINKLENLYSKIEKEFYFEENIDKEDMHNAVYKALLSSLSDKYSEYYTAEEYEELFMESEGTYYGIGSYVTMDTVKGYAYLAGVFDDSPASRAGMRDGDYIYKVNGVDVGGYSLNDIVALIKGPENTDVNITVYREGAPDYIDFVVTRGKIYSPTVTSRMLTDEIGYIKIQEFDDITKGQFKEAYDGIKKNDAKALIIDLRSNGGGNLDTVLEVCEQILPKGLITYIEYKNGTREEYRCNGKNEIKIPLVVLTNGYTASASELMTGAIRDYKLGTIIGTNTFGKGIVQSVFSNGDGTGIKLTTASYYTPSGECIHLKGIAPDIELEYDSELYYSEGIDNQLEYAKEYLNKQIGK